MSGRTAIVTGASRSIGKQIAVELGRHGANVVVELMSDRGVVDADAAVPMELPTKTVLHVVTAADPMTFTGPLLGAADFTSLLA